MPTEVSNDASKSERKRAARKVLTLAETLASMPRERRVKLLRDPDLVEAVELAARLKRSARKRQIMRVAKLLRDQPEDFERLEAELASDAAWKSAKVAQFNRIGPLREKFLADELGACELLRRTMSAQEFSELTSMRGRYKDSFSDREQRTLYRKIFRAIFVAVSSQSDGCEE